MGNDLVDGHKAMGATFVNVGEVAEDGSQGIWISQLAASGSDKFGGTGNPTIVIDTLKPNGSSDLTFSYHKGDKTRGYTTDGWYRGTKVITSANDLFLPAGTGLWVAGSEGLTLTTSGEVLLDSQLMHLVDGKRLVTNPFPAEVKLSTLIAAGAEKFGGTGNPTLVIDTLKPNGSSDLTFSYHKGDKTRGYTNDGWYRGTKQITEAAANDYTIKPGESLWVSGTSELSLTFVSPFEDAE